MTAFFFSLVDYHNDYFMSNDLAKLLEFYDGFSTKNELIQWIRERPKGNCVIKEFEGDKDIIVVIPTIDIESKLAKNCRENIFKGLHIIFVESGYNNFYFNYAHNCNVGIKKAEEYNPKWIIVSNDDMIPVDNVEHMFKVINSSSADIILPQKHRASKSSKFPIRMYFSIIKRNIFYDKMKGFTWYWLYGAYGKRIHNLSKKQLDIHYIIVEGVKNEGLNRFISLLLNIVMKDVPLFNSFGIFKSKVFKLEGFDESFINGYEDYDLMLRLLRGGFQVQFSNFQIADIGGQSLNKYYGNLRPIKTFVSAMNFDNKLQIYFSKPIKKDKNI